MVQASVSNNEFISSDVVAITALSDDHADLKAAIERLKKLISNLAPEEVDDDLRKQLASVGKMVRQVRRPEPHDDVISTPATADPNLAELDRRLGIVRDRVRGVAEHGQPGFYLYGRAGTAKTYTVRTTLDEIGCDYEYQLGHLTPIGLFDLLEANSTKIIVLDDVATIFGQPAALNILLAALGKQPDGRRIVKYKRQGRTVSVEFTGGIIAISNLELHGNAVMDALKSRLQPLNYNPTDDQIGALMHSIASKGYTLPDDRGRLSPREAGLVTEFLLGQTKRLGLDPDVRMQVDKAFRDYCQWKTGETETSWKDLIVSSLEDRLTELKYSEAALPVPSKREEKAGELKLLEKIMKECSTPQEQLDAFVAATGKSLRTCQRRMRQLKTTRTQPQVE